jgi:hypothetical protein
MRLPNREYGSGRLVFLENELVSQISAWRRRVECVTGFYRHELRLRPYRVRDMDGKPAATDPTLWHGRCSGCDGIALVSPDFKSGMRMYGLRGRCRGVKASRALQARSAEVRVLNNLCDRRGNKPLIAREPSRQVVIRTLGDAMYSGGEARVFRL